MPHRRQRRGKKRSSVRIGSPPMTPSALARRAAAAKKARNYSTKSKLATARGDRTTARLYRSMAAHHRGRATARHRR